MHFDCGDVDLERLVEEDWKALAPYFIYFSWLKKRRTGGQRPGRGLPDELVEKMKRRPRRRVDDECVLERRKDQR